MPASDLVVFKDVYKHYPLARGFLGRQAGRLSVLNGVTLAIREGETLGLVGESGCGKSTLAKLLVKLIEPSAGEIAFRGRMLSDIRGREKKGFYRQVGMIFQDPFSSLNPSMKVRSIIGEMARISGASRASEANEVVEMLGEVGLDESALDKYPHEFSGGQRQRIAIARALIGRPRLLIADEPVSALDLSTQCRILDLLKRLKAKYNLTILFVSHDLDAVAGLCNRVAVMYLGRIVEVVRGRGLFHEGLHPYLKALIACAPAGDPSMRRQRNHVIAGEVPSPRNLPAGCAFHPRCPIAEPICSAETPPLVARKDANHRVACHLI